MLSNNALARPRAGWIRRLTLSLVALSLAMLALVGAAPSARADAVASVGGTGQGSSDTFSLEVGLYRVDLTYSGNEDEEGVPEFLAWMEDSDRKGWILADDYESSNTVSRIMEITTPDAWHVVVDERVAVDSVWTVEVTPMAAPSTTSTSMSVKGTGPNAATPHRLRAGTYRVNLRYSGNVDAYGETVFYFGLNGPNNSWQDVTDPEQELDTANTLTRTLKVPSTGVYWFEAVYAGKGATWSADAVLLKTLSTTPTPKISGTVKVGKTLKAVPGTWKPSGVKLSYQWYRGSSKISGATKSSYKLTSKDKGKTIKVTVTGSKSGYVTVSKTSKSTSKVK